MFLEAKRFDVILHRTSLREVRYQLQNERNGLWQVKFYLLTADVILRFSPKDILLIKH
jgi:hypothetical protein